MQIDWITVSAQIVNFLVLVFLLHRFLYDPVTRAMQKREAGIAERLGEAGQREAEAERQAQSYQREKDRLAEERQSMLDAYRQQADEEKERLLEQARAEALQVRHNWHVQVRKERRTFLHGLQTQIASAVTDIAARALADLADVQLEERVVATFLERLEAMDETALEGMVRSDGKVLITTAHSLAIGQREQIERALRQRFDREVEFDYAQSDDLVFGIRVGSSGYALDWNLPDYMDQISERVSDAVADESAQD
ncbi:MAG TPA: hypothetical protein VK972_04540 [Wenzhouxiangella sp.]|nr:hypothetical protein [Wenzhouxiangella sp.]